MLVVVVMLSVSLFGQQQSSTDPNSTSHSSLQETVVVTGSYSPIPLQESDRTVEVIDTNPSATLFRSWADALRLDPSIDLRQRSPGTQADLSIRGSSFEQTLVLLDGIRINDAQSGHHDLDLPIPFESVERVEVLHGSGSTLYGSDAVGGAVNFITRSPVATELRLGGGIGNFGTNTQNGDASFLATKWSEDLTFTRDFSSGFMPDRDYRNFATASETRFETGLGQSDVLLGLSDRPFGADQFYGNFNSWERTKGWFVGGSQHIGENTEVAFGYRRHTDEFVLIRDQPNIYENNHVTDSWQGALREHTKLTPNTGLYYGAEVYRDAIDSNNLGHHSRDRGAVYFDYDARALGRFSLSIGLREELFSRGTADLSPTISGGYWLSPHLRLRASVAHAFRLPSYTDLYYSDPANLGNPNLRPEKAWGYEGGLEGTLGARLLGSITLFNRREHDVIDYVRSSATSPWQAVNIDNLRFTGVELSGHFKVNDSQQIDLGYTALYGAQQARAQLQSKYVSDYPVNQATIGWLGSISRFVQVRGRAGITQRYHLSSYPLVEFSASHQFRAVQPYFQVTNATNTGYEEIQGVRMPGRAYLAGIQVILVRNRR
jgi:iron complex outermembrane receptor protein